MRMDEHLGIPVDALIEFLVRDRGVGEGDVVADDEARVGAAGDDQVAQLPVVVLDVALAGGEGEALWMMENG